MSVSYKMFAQYSAHVQCYEAVPCLQTLASTPNTLNPPPSHSIVFSVMKLPLAYNTGSTPSALLYTICTEKYTLCIVQGVLYTKIAHRETLNLSTNADNSTRAVHLKKKLQEGRWGNKK